MKNLLGITSEKRKGKKQVGKEKLLDHKEDLIKFLLDQRRALQQITIKGMSH